MEFRTEWEAALYDLLKQVRTQLIETGRAVLQGHGLLQHAAVRVLGGVPDLSEVPVGSSESARSADRADDVTKQGCRERTAPERTRGRRSTGCCT
jgi:hypothetical protein